jgi:hypothetical protein
MRRKTNSARRKTAMVFNPAGRVLAGGSRINPARKRRRSHSRRRRSNPIAVKTAAVRRRNPIRRRRNPSSVGGLVVASLMAGLGVSVFDILTTKFLPSGSPWLRVGVKAGGAYAFQTGLGRKVPVLGKYSNEIALVLGVSAAVDVLKLVVFPAIAPTLQSVGLTLPTAADSTMGNIYGNAYSPSYAPIA